jgi:hypothetical protein
VCDGFIAWSWKGSDVQRLLIVVNYAATQGQCYLRLSSPALSVPLPDSWTREADTYVPVTLWKSGREICNTSHRLARAGISHLTGADVHPESGAPFAEPEASHDVHVRA